MKLTREAVLGAVIGAVLGALGVVAVYETTGSADGATAATGGEAESGSGGPAGAEGGGRGGEGGGAASSSGRKGTSSGRSAPASSLAELRQENADLLAAKTSQAREIEDLRTRIDELEKGGGAGPGKVGENFFPRTPADLDIMARHCGVRLDEPPIMGLEPGKVGGAAKRLNLSPEDVTKVEAAIAKAHRDLLERLRPLYVEATGDEEGSLSRSPESMFAEIKATAMEGENQRAMKQIAQERAGIAEPTTALDDASAVERAFRLRVALGDEFQRELASIFGAERAHDLRAMAGGWPWSRSDSRYCRPEE